MKECDLNTSEQGRSSLIFYFCLSAVGCVICFLFCLMISHCVSCAVYFFCLTFVLPLTPCNVFLTSAIVCLWVNVPIFLVIFVVCFFPSIKIHCMQRKLLLAITNGHLGTHTFAIYCLRIVKVPIVLVFSIRCNIERQFTKPIE